MLLSACAVSHKGNIREINEDNVYFSYYGLIDSFSEVFHIKKNSDLSKPELFSVFDGMGGMSSGEVASNISASVTKQLFETQQLPFSPNDMMLDIFNRANDALCQEMISSSRKRIGSTASMMCFYEKRYFLCNIGDSPILHIKNGEIKQISVDHNERDTYFKLYGKEPASGQKFKLTQHLGIFPSEMQIEPYTSEGYFEDDDVFIVCSDGLTDMVSLQEINAVVSLDLPADKAAPKLLDMALKNGGKDNITLIYIKFENA